MAWVKQRITNGNDIHLEKAFKGADINIAYCKKADGSEAPYVQQKPAERIYEFGQPEAQGKRNDILDCINNCHNIREVIDNQDYTQQFLRYGNKLTIVMQRKEETEYPAWAASHPLIIIWIAGPTGVGKTWAFDHDLFPNEKYPMINPLTGVAEPTI